MYEIRISTALDAASDRFHIATLRCIDQPFVILIRKLCIDGKPQRCIAIFPAGQLDRVFLPVDYCLASLDVPFVLIQWYSLFEQIAQGYSPHAPRIFTLLSIFFQIPNPGCQRLHFRR